MVPTTSPGPGPRPDHVTDGERNNDLVRIVTPELCTTSLIYDDSNHNLLAWIDPLGFRYTVTSTILGTARASGSRSSRWDR